MISTIGTSNHASNIILNEYGLHRTLIEQSDTGGTTTSADRVEISQEARDAAQAADHQADLSARAYNLLRIRNLSTEEITAFQDILGRADQAGDAKSFLKSLSEEERDLVRRANSYGIDLDDQHVDSMSQEGARNMLVQPDYRAFVDFNNDGVVDHGAAKTFSFPPPNAPEEVKDAWDKTVESLPEKERLLASSIFLVQSIQANGKVDEQGKTTGFYQPWDEGFRNIFPTEKEGWFTLLDKVEEYLDWSEKADPGNKEKIEKDRHLVEVFRDNLTAA